MNNQQLKNRVFEDMLYFVAEYRANELAGELPSDSEIEHPHIFSRSFESKMRKIIARQKRAESWNKYRGLLTKAAVIFIVATWILVARVEAVRVPVMNFYLEIKDEFTRIIMQDEDIKSPVRPPDRKELYLPNFIPDSYKLARISNNKDECIITYENDRGNSLTFIQDNDGKGISIDTEGAEIYETKINGNKSVVSIRDNKTIIVTITPERTFTLIGEIDKDIAIKIMQSVKLKK